MDTTSHVTREFNTFQRLEDKNSMWNDASSKEEKQTYSKSLYVVFKAFR